MREVLLPPKTLPTHKDCGMRGCCSSFLGLHSSVTILQEVEKPMWLVLHSLALPSHTRKQMSHSIVSSHVTLVLQDVVAVLGSISLPNFSSDLLGHSDLIQREEEG